jgi:hypothetical protein
MALNSFEKRGKALFFLNSLGPILGLFGAA